MMYLITGMPGNGKTLYAVDFIRKQLAKGRAVYTDIKGIKLEGVLPAADDWRTLPDGALVVYDEAHKRFPSFKGKGRSPLRVVQDMDEHRHRGMDLMFLTQWPDKVDGELFRLVGTHWHLNRAMGLQKASVVQFSRATMNPYSASARKGCDEEFWDFPKDLYTQYSSSSLHTESHKFQLPKKVKNALISIPFILLALWGFYAFMMSQFVGGVSEERSEAEPMSASTPSLANTMMPVAAQAGQVALTPGMGAYTPINTAQAPTLAGCVASDRGCRCFNVDGYQIDMAEHDCRATLALPLPFNVFHQFSVGTAPQRVAQGEIRTPATGVVPNGSPSSDQFPRSPGYQPGSSGPSGL